VEVLADGAGAFDAATLAKLAVPLLVAITVMWNVGKVTRYKVPEESLRNRLGRMANAWARSLLVFVNYTVKHTYVAVEWLTDTFAFVFVPVLQLKAFFW
jgi:hypothetical protein